MKCGEGTLQYDQNQVFQTLLFALTPADDFYKSFLQKHRSLGTVQKVLSRYKVNKQPKRQCLRESSGNSRNFITEDYGLWYRYTTDREDVQTLPSEEVQKPAKVRFWGSKTPANLKKTVDVNVKEAPSHAPRAASQITSVVLPSPPSHGGCLQSAFLWRSTITADKRPTWHIRSSDTCYQEKVHFQVALSLTSIWRWAPRQPLSRAEGKA